MPAGTLVWVEVSGRTVKCQVARIEFRRHPPKPDTFALEPVM
jgi:hypothetical protein